MQLILEHLEKKKYDIVNITTSIYDIKTESQYLKLIKDKSNTISYIKKTEYNSELFDPKKLKTYHNKTNYIFYWMHKYLALFMSEKSDKSILRLFDIFLDTECDSLICKICDKKSSVETCGFCFYNMCRTCMHKIDGHSKELLCPNCRKKTFPRVKNIRARDESDMDDDNPSVVFFTKDQLKEYGFLEE